MPRDLEGWGSNPSLVDIHMEKRCRIPTTAIQSYQVCQLLLLLHMFQECSACVIRDLFFQCIKWFLPFTPKTPHLSSCSHFRSSKRLLLSLLVSFLAAMLWTLLCGQVVLTVPIPLVVDQLSSEVSSKHPAKAEVEAISSTLSAPKCPIVISTLLQLLCIGLGAPCKVVQALSAFTSPLNLPEIAPILQ